MPRAAAEIVLVFEAAYLAAGAVFATAFVLVGAGRLDPDARKGSWPFRIAIFPASAALWPYLAWRWWRSR